MEDGRVGRAAADVEAVFDVGQLADLIDAADFVVAFDEGDVMLIVADDVEDFLHGLFEFAVADAAADVDGDDELGYVGPQVAWQVQPFRLAAVAPGRRLFLAAGDGADQLFQVPVPGQVFVFRFQGGNHAFQVVGELALVGRVDVFSRKLPQGLFVYVVRFVPGVVGLVGAVGHCDGFVAAAPFFGGVLFIRPQVQGRLYFFHVVFEGLERRQQEVEVDVDPVDGRGKGRQMVQVGIDDDVHGQVDGLLAVAALQLFGPDEVHGDDVQDLVLDGRFHLLRRQGEEDEGVEIEDIPRAFKGDAGGVGNAEADFLAHLKQEIAEEIVLVLHEAQVQPVDEGEKFPGESCWDGRPVSLVLLLPQVVGDEGGLLVQQDGFDGQIVFHSIT